MLANDGQLTCSAYSAGKLSVGRDQTLDVFARIETAGVHHEGPREPISLTQRRYLILAEREPSKHRVRRSGDIHHPRLWQAQAVNPLLAGTFRDCKPKLRALEMHELPEITILQWRRRQVDVSKYQGNQVIERHRRWQPGLMERHRRDRIIDQSLKQAVHVNHIRAHRSQKCFADVLSGPTSPAVGIINLRYRPRGMPDDDALLGNQSRRRRYAKARWCPETGRSKPPRARARRPVAPWPVPKKVNNDPCHESDSLSDTVAYPRRYACGSIPLVCVLMAHPRFGEHAQHLKSAGRQHGHWGR